MKFKTFKEASDNFKMWSLALDNATESIIPQAQEFIAKGAPNFDGTPEQWAEIALRDISKKLDEVMSAFDSMLESIGMPKRYQRYFD